jgi:CubicO group peptidase (beta-lactamase class C family)
MLLWLGLSSAEELPSLSNLPADHGPALNELAEELEDLLDDERVAGAAMAAVDSATGTWTHVFGYADRSQKRPVTNSTRFQAGDITKAITAIAVLQQVEAGHFDLDDTIDKLWPELTIRSQFPDRPAPTVRQLLTHHGGLPTSVLAGSYLARPVQTLTPLESVDIVQPNGEIYTYSHLGYVLLGHLVERYSKIPFTRYVTDRILTPLGMRDTGFDIRPDDALGHNKRRRPEPNLYPRDLPAQGLMTSVQDVTRLIGWMLKDDTRPVLARRWVDEMIRVQNADVVLDLDNRQGLAWQLTNTGRHQVKRVLRLNTSTIHFRGIVLIAPDEKLGVVVLANGSPGINFTLVAGRSALDRMLEGKFGIQPPKRDQEVPEFVELVAGVGTDAMQARYVTGFGLIEFAGQAQRYDMDFLGRGFSARRREDGWYELAYRLLGLFDLRVSLLQDVLIRPARINGHQILLGWYQDSQFLFGTAFETIAHDELAAMAGRYQLLNPDQLSESLDLKEVRLELVDGLLLASYRLPVFISLRPQLPLLPLGGPLYRIPGLGTNLGEIVRIDPKLKQLHYSGYHFQRSN